MNKTLRATLLIGVLGLMIVGLIYRETQLKGYKTEISEYEKALENEKTFSAVLNRRVDKLNERVNELELVNNKLLQQNKVLGDSVLILNTKVRALSKRIKIQSDVLKKSSAQLARLRGESDQLVSRVSELKQTTGADQKLIQELDSKRVELDKRIGVVFMEKDSIERKQVEDAASIANLTEQFNEQERILQIVENVQVAFDEVYTRRGNNKRARRIKQWDYTLINLQMNVPNVELIRGEQFIVKIIDKDNNKVLPPRESSGNKDTEGESFIFNGNPIPPIRYSNYQDKEGKNYMLQIFYVKDGKEYPLSFGVKDIKI